MIINDYYFMFYFSDNNVYSNRESLFVVHNAFVVAGV